MVEALAEREALEADAQSRAQDQLNAAAAHLAWTEQAVAEMQVKAQADAKDLVEDLYNQARTALREAEEDAAKARAEAQDEATRLLHRAQVEAKAQIDRAERRLAEAEAGARQIRERTNVSVEQLQRETYEQARAMKDEAMALLTQARVETDAMRSQARAMFDEARSESTALSRQRNDLHSTLGQLGGVIDAISVFETLLPNTTSEEMDQ